MDWIDEFVAIGSILDSERVRELQEEDIDIIIDAREAFKSVALKSEPIIPKVLRLADILVSLSEISKMHVRCLVHCTFGMDRTPFLAMVYVSKKYAMAYEEAYNYVKEKRPQTIFHPDWIQLLKSYTIPERT